MEAITILRIKSNQRVLDGQAHSWWRSDPERLQFMLFFVIYLPLAFLIWNGNRNMLKAAYATHYQETNSTQGEVVAMGKTSIFCTGTESNESASYKYLVDGVEYAAVSPANRRGNPDKLSVGSTVTVKYVLEDPAVSIIEGQVSDGGLFVGAWLVFGFSLIGGVGTLYNLVSLIRLYRCRRDGEAVDAVITSVGKSMLKGKEKIHYSFESPNSGKTLAGKVNVPEGHLFCAESPAKVWYASDRLYILL